MSSSSEATAASRSRQPRQRAALVLHRAAGDIIYVNSDAVAVEYLKLIANVDVDDLSARSAVLKSAVEAHHTLNVINETPSHTLAGAVHRAGAVLSRTERSALNSIKKKSNMARHHWPSFSRSSPLDCEPDPDADCEPLQGSSLIGQWETCDGGVAVVIDTPVGHVVQFNGKDVLNRIRENDGETILNDWKLIEHKPVELLWRQTVGDYQVVDGEFRRKSELREVTWKRVTHSSNDNSEQLPNLNA